MAKSLAQLRVDAKPRLGERTYDNLCLAQDLVSRVQALQAEKTGLEMEAGLDQLRSPGNPDAPDPDEPTKPRRMGDPRQARVAEIDAELETLYQEMREHSGDLVLRATPASEWQRWVGDHPARVVDRDANGSPVINPVDESVTLGFCDASALLDDLGKYIVSWAGEIVGPDDIAYLIANAAPGDIKEVCRIVVTLHEGPGARAPKVSSTSSSATETPVTA